MGAMNVPYKYMHLDQKESSPILCNKILCKPIKSDLQNLSKIESCSFEILIWDA